MSKAWLSGWLRSISTWPTTTPAMGTSSNPFETFQCNKATRNKHKWIDLNNLTYATYTCHHSHLLCNYGGSFPPLTRSPRVAIYKINYFTFEVSLWCLPGNTLRSACTAQAQWISFPAAACLLQGVV